MHSLLGGVGVGVVVGVVVLVGLLPPLPPLPPPPVPVRLHFQLLASHLYPFGHKAPGIQSSRADVGDVVVGTVVVVLVGLLPPLGASRDCSSVF